MAPPSPEGGGGTGEKQESHLYEFLFLNLHLLPFGLQVRKPWQVERWGLGCTSDSPRPPLPEASRPPSVAQLFLISSP